MNKTKGCILCAAPEFSDVGGLGLYMHNLIKYLSNKGWITHCLAANNKSDNYKIKEYTRSFYDISEQPLSLKKIFKAAEIINQIKPDVLLLNHCALAHYALPLLTKNIKPIAILHSNDSRFYETATIFGDRVFRWIAPTISVARNAVSYIGEKKIKRISLIPHGIDNGLFFAEKRKKNSICNITFVGYVAENKGADLLLPIMKRVALEHSDCHLTIVGYGPLQDSIEQQFSDAGLYKNLTTTGKVSHEKVAEILKSSDILLHPTRIEGFGLAVAEAMMSGAVPVVSKISGITDTIVANNETGILVKVDDVEEFSSAVIDLLSNPDRLAVMKQSAQKTAQEKFTLQRMISDYERLFEEEDDRPALPKRGIAGWTFETLREILQKNPDGTYRFQKKLGTFKKI
jgi:glycosyltransferase involved in cell wall biosynthesis